MKAIIDNNKTYKYISTKGAFYVCEDMNGKAKMFEASKVELVEIDSMPKAKKYGCARSSDEKRAEKMMVTAHHAPLTAQEKEDLRIEMEKSKWASKSF